MICKKGRKYLKKKNFLSFYLPLATIAVFQPAHLAQGSFLDLANRDLASATTLYWQIIYYLNINT